MVEKIDPTQMGPRRRRMALLITLIGLATFVTPLIGTDPGDSGRTRWSPLQILLALHAGELPAHHTIPADRMFLGIDAFLGLGVVYILLGVIALAIMLSPSARFIASVAATGAAITLGSSRHGYFDLQETIYGSPGVFASGHQIHAGTNCLILVGVLGLLGFIAVTKQLD